MTWLHWAGIAGYVLATALYFIGLCVFTRGTYWGHVLRALVWPLDMTGLLLFDGRNGRGGA